MKPKIVIVLGPTAVGKTELALAVAPKVNAEIVNADSQQVYRYLDIGTGKPSKPERERVRHHLIDVVNPDEDFNAARYRQLAAASIDEIHKRGAKVLVSGGTGLYLKALTGGLFSGPSQDTELRANLEREIAQIGLAALYDRLIAIDPGANTKIHPNDRQRIIRALEVYQSTGRPLSEWQNEHRFQEEAFQVLKIGLARARAELYDLINRRSESMIRAGLLGEVRGLMERGYELDLKPLRSVGYRQMGEVIEGIKGLPEAIAEMKQETRRLAKRQLTWFRSDPEIRWFHPEKQEREIGELVQAFLL
ncbi:MAG TPA: tRNA (adenosine(37)-N6)-dimethylallyltransferase MiaA [Candidatus Eisenbacteria bacterium]|nr:tRNA (adenosine(37)-N6)-dimethylallyltransferase MiaA [Candidatus Eisenbacteria bacterium]